ncbi:MAG: hypothetical protein WCY82_04990 [Desulfotomaculaceae bacterium]
MPRSDVRRRRWSRCRHNTGKAHDGPDRGVPGRSNPVCVTGRAAARRPNWRTAFPEQL